MRKFFKENWVEGTREDKMLMLIGILSIPFGAASMWATTEYTTRKSHAEMARLPLIPLETPYKGKTYREFCNDGRKLVERKVLAPDKTPAKIRCP